MSWSGLRLERRLGGAVSASAAPRVRDGGKFEMLPTSTHSLAAGKDVCTGLGLGDKPNFQAGSAAAKCSNQGDQRPTLFEPNKISDLPQRPSLTAMRLVCIEILRVSTSATSSNLVVWAPVCCPA